MNRQQLLQRLNADLWASLRKRTQKLIREVDRFVVEINKLTGEPEVFFNDKMHEEVLYKLKTETGL